MDIWHACYPDDTTTFTFTKVKEEQAAQVHASSIRLAPFSDHHLVYTWVMLWPACPRPAYWHFKHQPARGYGLFGSLLGVLAGLEPAAADFSFGSEMVGHEECVCLALLPQLPLGAHLADGSSQDAAQEGGAEAELEPGCPPK